MKKLLIFSAIIGSATALFFGIANASPDMLNGIEYLKKGRHVSVEKSESKVYTVLENGAFGSSFEHTVPTKGYSMVSLHTTGIDCNFAGEARWKIGDDIYGKAFGIHGDEEGFGRTMDNGVSAPEMLIRGLDGACTSNNATIKVYLRVLGGSSLNN